MTLRIVQIILGIILVAVSIMITVDFIRHRKEENITKKDDILYAIVGVVVNFFDVLGIGSFAPTLSLYNIFNLKVPERKIGGTLNGGVAGVVLFEALLFLSSVKVSLTTLILMELCALLGTVVGVKLNEKISVVMIQYVMAIGLMLAAALMLLGKFGLMPMGGDLTGLTGWKLIVALITAFVLGAGLMFGIGNYAPCMCVIYLLGMNPICAFPIMMTMGGLCSTSSAVQSVRNGLIVRHSAFYMMIGGFVGAAFAYFVVKSMSVSTLTWLVIVVVIYASIQLFFKARKGNRS